MATLAQKIKCERDARELCANSGLPEPDWIEYGYTCIRLFWERTKTVLVIDIDGPDALDEAEEAGGPDTLSQEADGPDALSEEGGGPDALSEGAPG